MMYPWSSLSVGLPHKSLRKVADMLVVQLLEDEPLEVVKPLVQKLIADKDQNKQRAAAEILAGVLNGAKHWPVHKQDALWEWFNPHIKTILRKNIKSDTLSIWSSFLEYMFYRTDPRRVQPLVDFIWKAFRSMDYNPELSFDATKVITLFRSLYEEMGRKFVPWMDETTKRAWSQIANEHDHVRAFIGEILAFSQNIKVSSTILRITGRIHLDPEPSGNLNQAYLLQRRSS
jgi:proteasome activator subunit 4